MAKRNFVILIVLIILLAMSILLMSISLMVKERTFGQVSGYIAIAAVVITMVGVVLIVRSKPDNSEIEAGSRDKEDKNK